MHRLFQYISLVLAALFLSSCSTTRALQDDQYRLSKNKIELTNSKGFNPDLLNPYLKQKHRGWSPLMSVYNWTNGKGKGWDKFVQKIGIAPVVYDPQLVDNSIENIDNHLEYLGYYGSHVSSSIDVNRRNVTVTYAVTLGKRIPIKAIEVELPDNLEFAADFRDRKSVV